MKTKDRDGHPLRSGPAVGFGVSSARNAGQPTPGLSSEAESRAWISRLSSGARPSEREAAARELHALLLRAARHALATKRSLLPQLGREGIDDLAREAADDALLAVLGHLDDFRGESRFTTWAWKFAFLQACVAIRKRRWLGREIPIDSDGWDRLAEKAGPDERAEQAELLAEVRRGVEQALTVHQRSVFVALALNEVPVDVLAERLGTTRGALYKTLHDARERLRRHLSDAGLLPEMWHASPKRPESELIQAGCESPPGARPHTRPRA